MNQASPRLRSTRATSSLAVIAPCQPAQVTGPLRERRRLRQQFRSGGLLANQLVDLPHLIAVHRQAHCPLVAALGVHPLLEREARLLNLALSQPPCAHPVVVVVRSALVAGD